MKPILSFLSILFFLSQTVRATNRTVEQNGANGAYTTISAAIAAAATGDRIIIYPATYAENVTVNKNSLMILSASQGSFYSVQGNITFTGAGSNLMECEVIGNIVDNGNLNRVANCFIVGTVTCSPTVIAFIDHNFINPGITALTSQIPGITISRGRVSGCTIEGLQGISVRSGVTPSNDSMVIVGNNMHLDAYNPIGIIMDNPQQFMYVANNFISIQNAIQHSGNFMRIDSLKSSSTIYNAIVNNTGISTLNEGIYDLAYGFDFEATTGNADVENNILNTVSAHPLNNFSTNFQFIYRYNYSNQFNNISSGIDGSNVYSTNNSVDASTGALTSGLAINGGNPALAYLDLDRSQNDAGCYGGSYSIANFNQANNGSVVLFMKMPRVVLVNQTFGFSGDGVAK